MTFTVRLDPELERRFESIYRRSGTTTSAAVRKLVNEYVARQLASVSRRAMKTRDEERRRLCAELHDGVAQDLSSVRVILGLLRELRLTAGDARRAELIAQASALAKRLGDSIREIMIGCVGRAIEAC